MDNRTHEDLCFKIGLASLHAARAHYQEYRTLRDAELQIFSQFGEDGIIDFLTSRLGIQKPSFIEIGTGDYSESNTRFLYQRTCGHGHIIDCDPNLQSKALKTLGSYMWKGTIHVTSAFVSLSNIKEILKSGHGEGWSQADILSIDIDGNDYWILKEIIPDAAHKIIITEYNSVFGPSKAITTPYTDSFDRSKYHYANLCYGASLKAIYDLLTPNGYTLAGTNLFNNNAFWVRSDFSPCLGFLTPQPDQFQAHTTNYLRESRAPDGSLSYLWGDQRLHAIKECRVIDLSSEEQETTIQNLFGLGACRA